nr:L,D-transpeptidase family protein [uncultured Acetatifactor sp.]
MRKIFRFLLVFLLCGLLLGLAGFLALALYYRNNFPVNTWINGVYCTGKTIEQVNEELVNACEASMLTVVDGEGNSWEINMEDAGIRPDYTAELKAYLRENTFFDWLENLNNSVSSVITAGKYLAEEEKLRKSFEALSFVGKERDMEDGAVVRRDESGFYFVDGNAGRLNEEKAYSVLKECLEQGVTTVNLEACYEDFSDSPTDKAQRELWRQICAYTDKSSKIVYDMGAETIVFTPDITAQFLKAGADDCPILDESGKIMVDEEAVQSWVEQLAADYNTCDTEKEFEATRGDTVTVKYVTYGTELDTEAEKQYLLEALQSEYDRTGTEIHIPAYLQEGYVRGRDDIGGTYIEIDMTEQKMYYYAEGERILETDIVTGNTGRRMGTPQGINFVYGKERNRTLRGPGYASFVKYWVPVKGNIGIHDASWRSKFGGEIYKTNGSHGCINTPTDIMSELYDMVEIGTPVIMFY